MGYAGLRVRLLRFQALLGLYRAVLAMLALLAVYLGMPSLMLLEISLKVSFLKAFLTLFQSVK